MNDLTTILLGIGGTRVIDPDTNEGRACVERGHLWDKRMPVRKMKGLQSNCHGNCALEYWRSFMEAKITDSGITPIATGYGLNDGVWRPHSWLRQGYDILETTVKREKYFGVELTERESLAFLLGELRLLPAYRELLDQGPAGMRQEIADTP